MAFAQTVILERSIPYSRTERPLAWWWHILINDGIGPSFTPMVGWLALMSGHIAIYNDIKIIKSK